MLPFDLSLTLMNTPLVRLDGVEHRVLVDTECSRSIAHVSCCEKWNQGAVGMITEWGGVAVRGKKHRAPPA